MPSSYAAIRRVAGAGSSSPGLSSTLTSATTNIVAANLSRKNHAKNTSYLTGISNPLTQGNSVPNAHINVSVASKVGRTGGSVRSNTYYSSSYYAYFKSLTSLSSSLSFSTKCGPLRIAATRERNMKNAQRLWQQAQPAQQAQQPAQPKEMSPHAAIYVNHGKPFLKVVAIALTTFFALKYSRIALVEEADAGKNAQEPVTA